MMRPPEEVAKDIIRTASISAAAAIIAADRKEAVAEFVREVDAKLRPLWETEEDPVAAQGIILAIGTLQATAREKGIDLP